DVWRGHGFDIGQPGDPSKPAQSRGGKAPVDEAVAVIHLARFVDLDSRGLPRQVRTVGLDDDLAGRRQDVGQRPQQRVCTPGAPLDIHMLSKGNEHNKTQTLRSTGAVVSKSLGSSGDSLA